MRRCLVLLAVLALPFAPGRALAGIWVVPSTTKVLPGATSSGVTRVDLDAVRNEWVAFQVVVDAGNTPLAGVDATLSDLANGAEGTIPGGQAGLYREYYVDLRSFASACENPMNSTCDEHPEYLRMPGWYPDALIPFRDPYGDEPRDVGSPFDVAAGSQQVVYAELQVPSGIPAGTYEGMFTVTASGTPIATLPVALRVLDVDLPTQRTVATAFNFSVGALPDYHGGADGGDAATRERIWRNYELEVHRHRIDFSRPGPRIAFTFDADGALIPPDYTAYDAYWQPRVDGSRYPDGAGVVRWDLGMFKPGGGNLGMTDAQYKDAVTNLVTHLQEKGFLEHVYMYGTDEPFLPEKIADGAYERIQADVARLRTATNLLDDKVMITGPWQETLDSSVGIWCPDTAMFDSDYWPAGAWASRAKYRELLDAGRQLWLYVCNQNFPALMGYDVDSPVGHEPRLLKWGAWYEGASGFLYWRMTYWMEPDPWNVLSDPVEFGEMLARNGDGILLYPGDHDGLLGQDPPPPWPPIDGPVTSLRLKQIRDGLEDWELLKRTAANGGDAFARRQVERVYHRFGAPLDEMFDPAARPWSLDDAELLDARQQVALKLQYLLHPDLYPDPEVPATPDADDASEAPDSPSPQDVAEASGDSGPAVPESSDLATSDTTAPDPDDGGPVPDAKKGSGGGCSTGRSGGTAPAFLLLAALALAIRVRRRTT